MQEGSQFTGHHLETVSNSASGLWALYRDVGSSAWSVREGPLNTVGQVTVGHSLPPPRQGSMRADHCGSRSDGSLFQSGRYGGVDALGENQTLEIFDSDTRSQALLACQQ